MSKALKMIETVLKLPKRTAITADRRRRLKRHARKENAYGMTFAEWLYVATGSHSAMDDYTSERIAKFRAAWLRGEEP